MKHTKNPPKIKLIHTAGGKITCARCAAKSKRSGLQCARPAMSGKTVCDIHGGRSTGPRTPEGKRRNSAAHTKSGRYSRQQLEADSRDLTRIRQLEDAMYIQGMTTSPRTSGRKPNGYKAISTIQEVVSVLQDTKQDNPPLERN